MRDTNSPGAMSRSIPDSATVDPLSRVPNTLSTPLIWTTDGVPASVMGRGSWVDTWSGIDAGATPECEYLGDPNEQEECDAQRGRDEDRRPQLLGTRRVVLVERGDDPAEALLDRARVLADDRAHDRRGGRDLEGREQ